MDDGERTKTFWFMLKEVIHFFRREPKYFWIFCAILAFYGLYSLTSGGSHHRQAKTSKGIKTFQTAERQWNKEMEKDEGFRNFVRQKPLLAVLFQGLTAFFFLAFMVGLFVDFVFLARGSSRARFSSSLSPPLTGGWNLTMLSKIILLFIFWGIVLSLLIGVFQVLFPKGASDNFYMILHTLMLHMITFYCILRLITGQGGRWQELGLQIPPFKTVLNEIKVGFLGYCGVLPFFILVVGVLLTVAGLVRYEPPPHPLMTVFLEEKHAKLLLGASIALGTVIGPVFEEIFFRGFCYPILRNRWGRFWATVLSAAFFAGIHHSGFVFWPIFVLGIGLAYLYEKRKSLIAPMTLHVLHNTVFITYFFLVKQILGDQGF